MHTIDVALIAAYLIVLLTIGLTKSRSEGTGSIESYLLDGRRLTLPAFVATLVSTWYGGILGVGEFSYRYGLSNWLVFGVPYYTSAFIFARLIARRARRSELLTIPQQFERVYGTGTARLGSLFIFIMTVPAAYVLMLGVLLNFFTGWSLPLCIALGGFFSLFYVIRGGFRSVVRTDLFQFVLMFGGFGLLIFYAVRGYGGLDFLLTSLPATHTSWHGGNGAGYILVWFFIALGTLVEPAFYQRCFAAKTEKTAKNGILISVLFWILFDFLTTTSGLYARTILPNLEDPMASYLHLADHLLPPLVLGIFYVALLATIMSTVDSYNFIAGMTIGRDFMGNRQNKRFSVQEYTKIGLIFSTLLSIGIAAYAQSVVRIWKDLGSIGTPALLLPLVSSFSRRWQMSPHVATPAMLSSALISALWIGSKEWSGSSDYWWSIEPIYPGLLISLLFYGGDQIAFTMIRKRQEAKNRN
ncbi:sodium:solute symporter family protein [candidate division KSB1 bacterium]|nr:sodium:solute symporter family protein [candidate division KSB1 bacterium]